MGLAAVLEYLKRSIRLNLSSIDTDLNLLKLAGSKDMHNILDEWGFQPDLATKNS